MLYNICNHLCSNLTFFLPEYEANALLPSQGRDSYIKINLYVGNGPSRNSYIHISLRPNVEKTEIKLSGLFPSLLENISLFKVCEKV